MPKVPSNITPVEEVPQEATVPARLPNYTVQRRNAVIGMIVSVGLINMVEKIIELRHPTITPVMGIVLSILNFSGLVTIAFYFTACRAYARMKNIPLWVGTLVALGGIFLGLSIVTYLQWPVIYALLNDSPTPEWDQGHLLIALSGGLAAGGFLLKAIAVQRSSGSDASADDTTPPAPVSPASSSIQQKKA